MDKYLLYVVILDCEKFKKIINGLSHLLDECSISFRKKTRGNRIIFCNTRRNCNNPVKIKMSLKHDFLFMKCSTKAEMRFFYVNLQSFNDYLKRMTDFRPIVLYMKDTNYFCAHQGKILFSAPNYNLESAAASNIDVKMFYNFLWIATKETEYVCIDLSTDGIIMTGWNNQKMKHDIVFHSKHNHDIRVQHINEIYFISDIIDVLAAQKIKNGFTRIYSDVNSPARLLIGDGSNAKKNWIEPVKFKKSKVNSLLQQSYEKLIRMYKKKKLEQMIKKKFGQVPIKLEKIMLGEYEYQPKTSEFRINQNSF